MSMYQAPPEGTLNLPLLEHHLRWVRDHERMDGTDVDGVGWYQDHWFAGKPSEQPSKLTVDYGNIKEQRAWDFVEVTCGSTACLAGNIVYSAGDRMVVHAHALPDEDGKVTTSYCLPKDGTEVELIAFRANELLGLSKLEGHDMFDGENSYLEIVKTAQFLAVQHFGVSLAQEFLDDLEEAGYLVPLLGGTT